MAGLNLNKHQQRKVSLFAMCILVSALVWAVFAMSNNYMYRMEAPVEYVNAPEKKAFHPLQSDTVTLQIEGSGWQLLFSRLRLPSKAIHVDISALRTRNWVSFSSQLGYVNRQFDATQRVVSVSPDTLYFDFSRQSSKKVPVKLNTNLTFRPQYDIIDTIRLSPAYVTLTGPLDDLAGIDHWETDTLSARNINADLVARIGLRRKRQTNINIYPSMIEVRVPVGEVTEKVLDLPVKVEHGERYSSVKLLPEKIRLTVMVSLRDFARTNADSFEAVVDLNDWVNRRTSSLPVLITRSPDFCRVLKIEPQNVDFLVRK
jgi:YbbR domain-containing protein